MVNVYKIKNKNYHKTNLSDTRTLTVLTIDSWNFEKDI
jgi:hypothetical protein